jgi:hypothetical protein
LTLDQDEIENLVDRYDSEARAIKDEALRISWYMRGGVTYDDAMALSPQERESISKIIKKNMEVTKESGLPFF